MKSAVIAPRRAKVFMAIKIVVALLLCLLLIYSFSSYSVSLWLGGINPGRAELVDDFLDCNQEHIRVAALRGQEGTTLVKLREQAFGFWRREEEPEALESPDFSFRYLGHASSYSGLGYAYMVPNGGPWVDGPRRWEKREYLYGDNAAYLITVPEELLAPNETVSVRQTNERYIITLSSCHGQEQDSYQTIQRIEHWLVSQKLVET